MGENEHPHLVIKILFKTHTIPLKYNTLVYELSRPILSIYKILSSKIALNLEMFSYLLRVFLGNSTCHSLVPIDLVSSFQNTNYCIAVKTLVTRISQMIMSLLECWRMKRNIYSIKNLINLFTFGEIPLRLRHSLMTHEA